MADVDAERIEKERESFVSWSRTTSSLIRLRSIEGTLLGVAVGEALGVSRDGLSRRAALRMFGGTPFDYKLLPSIGIASHQTHYCCLAGQAVLRSCQKESRFSSAFRNRSRGYLAISPHLYPTLLRNLLSDSGSFRGFGLASTILLTVSLQGSGCKGSDWISSCNQPSEGSKESHLTEAQKLLTLAAKVALHSEAKDVGRSDTFRFFADQTSNPETKRILQLFEEHIEDQRTAKWVARSLGWGKRIPSDPKSIVLMSLYCWVRHPKRYRLAVESAISLGGPTSALGAIVGGLSGANLGRKWISPKLLNRLGSWPHGESWLSKLALRLSEWPHGESDIHSAPALDSNHLGQLMRSAGLVGIFGFHRVLRLPWRILD